MSRRSRLVVFLVSTPLVAFIIVGGLLGATRHASQQGFRPLAPFTDAIGLILNQYVDNVNVDKVYDGAMRGLMDDLDTSSAYLPPDEVKTIDANTPLGPADVGLVVTHNYWLRVVGVRDGSPAARAKIATGDIIRMIDDTPARDMSALEGTRLLHGVPGSKVSVFIWRGSAIDAHQIDLVRELPPADRASGKRLPGGEAYVRVSSFDHAADAVRSAVQSLGSSATPGLIIDLRDVADGAPADGVAAAKLFVKSGTIATLAGRDPSDRTVTAAAPGDGAFAMPVVLLVSNGTANAAEVFAAALQDDKRARLVGEPTAGLASVQHLVRLPEGYGLWLTYEQYLRADGTPILEHGLRPDVFVDIPIVGFDEAPPATDVPLTRAVDELKRVEKDGIAAAPAAAAATPTPISKPLPTETPGNAPIGNAPHAPAPAAQ